MLKSRIIFLPLFLGVITSLLVLAHPALAALSSAPDEGTVQTDDRVSAMLVVGNRVYLGGDFTHVDGVARDGLAAIDATTGQLTNWNPAANGPVRALSASPDGSRIYAGGGFTMVNGEPRPHLVALDATTGALQAWRARTDLDSQVRAIAVSGNHVYIGGKFTKVNGRKRANLALVNGTTGALNRSWSPTTNGQVETLAVSPAGGRVYAGGDFTTVSGRDKPYLVALHASKGTLVSGWHTPRPNGRVLDIALLGRRVYTSEGGPGGAAAAYRARTGARAWRAHADGDVQAVTVMAGKAYFGGHFGVFSGQSRRSFAAVSASTGALDPQWMPSGSPTYPGVFELVKDASLRRLYVGGDFQQVSGVAHAHFAQFSQQ